MALRLFAGQGHGAFGVGQNPASGFRGLLGLGQGGAGRVLRFRRARRHRRGPLDLQFEFLEP